MLQFAVEADIPMIAADEHTVWLQADRSHGIMIPELSEVWEENRARVVPYLGKYTAASQVVRIKPKGVSGFVDLGDMVPAATVHTDGLITTNSELILHANPADCGELGVSAYSGKYGKYVIGLLHANRQIVSEGGHLDALDYLCETYAVEPAEMQVRMSPSARKASYALHYVNADIAESDAWRPYVEQDESGMWHVDFHGRTVDELHAFGVQPGNMDISPIDTVADARYFSNTRHNRGLEPAGCNGLFFALR